MNAKSLCATLILLLVLAACAQGTTEIKPPDIRYGEDVCIECNMIISDPRFAAGYAHEIAPGRYASIPFDDIGDMLAHAAKHPEHQIVAWYVHDYASKEWLDAAQAAYVFSSQVQSPMASGLAAHATRTAADAMAAELGGEVLDWEAVQARYAAGTLTVAAAPHGMDARQPMGDTVAATPPGTPEAMHEAMHQAMHSAMPDAAGEVVLGEAEVAGHQLQLIAHGQLHAGYNDVMVHLTGADGAPSSGVTVTYQPTMNMQDGRHHSAPVEQPAAVMPGMFHGAVAFTMPGGPDLGTWSLTVAVDDPATGAHGETTFDLDVAPSKLIGSFVAPDERKIFLAVVQPLAPGVGRQPLELLAFEKKSMMDWPAIDNLTVSIEPEMPTMGHGSPQNENPTSTGDGHYLGRVNFTMAGPWTVIATADRAGEPLGEVVFEFEVR